MLFEGGAGNESGTDLRSGMVFWYGEPAPAMALTDSLAVGNLESETKHRYKAPASRQWNLTSSFEGEFDHGTIGDTGRTLTGPSESIATIVHENHGVILRRQSDQLLRGQHAFVYVDGKKVEERD